LNLHALIGQQRASVDEMRMYWRLQDRIDLSEEEREAIGWQTREVNGQKQTAWDSSRGLPPKEFEMTDEEMKKVLNVVKSWQQGYMVGAERIWLEPLLGQLENGAQPAAHGATQ
jgi:hypothetical protein